VRVLQRPICRLPPLSDVISLTRKQSQLAVELMVCISIAISTRDSVMH